MSRSTELYMLLSVVACSTISAGSDIDSRLDAIEQKLNISVPNKNVPGPYFFGEFLYWKPSVTGLPYVATSEVEALPVGGGTGTNQQIHRVHFDFEPGFRVGVGYHLPFDRWDLGLIWNRFNGDGHGTQHRTDTTSLGTLWVTFVSNGGPLPLNAQKVKGHMDIDYDTLDLTLGKEILFSRGFNLRPFMGVRGAWIDHKLHIDSYGLSLATQFSDGTLFQKIDNDFKGVGLLVGLDGAWQMPKGFGFYGKGLLSLVWGEFEWKRRDNFDLTMINPPPAELIFSTDQKTKIQAVTASVDVELGVKWEVLFHKDRWKLTLNAGYEFIEWLNQQQAGNLFSFGDSAEDVDVSLMLNYKGDLGFRGYTIGARLDF